jgi:hypothetical protein
MPGSRARPALAGVLMLALTACNAGDERADEPKVETPALARPAKEAPQIGLMSSLPLYWPAGAELAQLAQGSGEPPWARAVIEQKYRLLPLDTLSPIAPLAPGDPQVDPLAGLDQLAVVQPRGLSAADNVALDKWVRAGGSLLLVLDPALTGEYPLALGDPRHPVVTALIPPVVKRWGIAMRFDERQPDEVRSAPLGDAALPLVLAGEWTVSAAGADACALRANGVLAVCRIGRGRVTLAADAALFEHRELAGERGDPLLALLDLAFRSGERP